MYTIGYWVCFWTIQNYQDSSQYKIVFVTVNINKKDT